MKSNWSILCLKRKASSRPWSRLSWYGTVCRRHSSSEWNSGSHGKLDGIRKSKWPYWSWCESLWLLFLLPFTYVTFIFKKFFTASCEVPARSHALHCSICMHSTSGSRDTRVLHIFMLIFTCVLIFKGSYDACVSVCDSWPIQSDRSDSAAGDSNCYPNSLGKPNMPQVMK